MTQANADMVPNRLSFVWKRCADCILVIAPGGQKVLLNATAGSVWELIDGRRTVADIAAALTTQGLEAEQVTGVIDLMIKEQVVTYSTYLWSED